MPRWARDARRKLDCSLPWPRTASVPSPLDRAPRARIPKSVRRFPVERLEGRQVPVTRMAALRSRELRARGTDDGLHLHTRGNPRRGRPGRARPAGGAERAQHCADRRAGTSPRPLRRERRHRRDGHHRKREGIRGRRRHLGDGRQGFDGHVRRSPLRWMGTLREGAQALDRGRRGLCAGWRMRARDGMRHHHRGGERPVSGNRKSSSGCFRGSAARSACRVSSARQRRWTSA